MSTAQSLVSPNFVSIRDAGAGADAEASRRKARISFSAVCLLIWLAICIWTLMLSKRPVFVDGVPVNVTSPLQRQIQNSASVFIVLGLLSETARLPRLMRSWATSPGLWVVIATVTWISVSSFFNESPASIAYALLLACAFLLSGCAWSRGTHNQKVMLNGFGLIATSFALSSILVYGPPNGRWVGGIHPNLFGYILVLGSIIGLIYWRVVGIIISLALILLAAGISSRYAMLAIVVVMAFLAFQWSSKKFGALSATSIALVIAPIALTALIPVISHVLLLDDPLRGVSSGGSGRTGMNARFFAQFSEHFVEGFGFRNRGSYLVTHNGYLNLALELGAISMLGVFSLVGLTGIRMHHLNMRQPSKENIALELLFATCLLSALFQPQLINFADSQGAVIIFAIGAALFGSRAQSSAKKAG